MGYRGDTRLAGAPVHWSGGALRRSLLPRGVHRPDVGGAGLGRAAVCESLRATLACGQSLVCIPPGNRAVILLLGLRPDAGLGRQSE